MSLSKNTGVLNVNLFAGNVQMGSEVKLGAPLLCLLVSDECEVYVLMSLLSSKTQAEIMQHDHREQICFKLLIFRNLLYILLNNTDVCQSSNNGYAGKSINNVLDGLFCSAISIICESYHKMES